MNVTLRYSGISGIVSIVFQIVTLVFVVLFNAQLDKVDWKFVCFFLLIRGVSLTAYVFFMSGFKLLAEKYQNHFLKFSAYAFIGLALIDFIWAILTLLLPNLNNQVIGIIETVLTGLASILFGGALLKLKSRLGAISAWTAVLGIVAGISFVSIILSPLGVLLCMPLYVLSSMVLLREARNGSSPSL